MILQLKFQQSFVVSVGVPQIPFIDRVVDLSVASQRQGCTVLTVQKTGDSVVQFWMVVDMPLVCQRQGCGSDSTENCGVPQVQHSDRVVERCSDSVHRQSQRTFQLLQRRVRFQRGWW